MNLRRQLMRHTGHAVLVLLVVVSGVLSVKLANEAPATAELVQVPGEVGEASPRAALSLWFGDSIVEGCCREDPASPSMAEVTAAELGWAPPNIQGSGGTGYITAGPVEGRMPYPERLPFAVEGARANVVIVEGGGNDPPDAEPLRASVREVLEGVLRAFPELRVVVLGPYSPTGEGYSVQRRVIGDEAARLELAYVDQVELGWMKDRPELLADDGFHPNSAGHAYLGERLAEALRQRLTPLDAD